MSAIDTIATPNDVKVNGDNSFADASNPEVNVIESNNPDELPDFIVNYGKGEDDKNERPIIQYTTVSFSLVSDLSPSELPSYYFRSTSDDLIEILNIHPNPEKIVHVSITSLEMTYNLPSKFTNLTDLYVNLNSFTFDGIFPKMEKLIIKL